MTTPPPSPPGRSAAPGTSTAADFRWSTQRGWFVLFCVLWLGGVWAIVWSLGGYRPRSVIFEEERLDKTLGDAATTVAATFDRLEWFKLQCRTLRRRLATRRGTGIPWRELANALTRRYPQAQVMVFDAQGRLTIPLGLPGRRSWEFLWEGLQSKREGVPPPPAAQETWRRAQRQCQAHFGRFTDLVEFVDPKAEPRQVLRRGSRVFSWVMPEAALGGDGPGSGGRGSHGGLWVLLDPERIPIRAVGAWAMRTLPPEIHHAAIVREVGRELRAETKERGELPTTAVMKRLIRGAVRVHDPPVAWSARYLPGEHGRWVVLGSTRPDAAGWAGKAPRWAMAAVFAASAFLWAAGYRVWWLGLPLGLELSGRVAGVFLGLAVFPLVLVTWLGFGRIEDAGRRERIRWEHRMQALFAGMEESFDRRLATRQDWCDRQERHIQDLVVASAPTPRLQQALENLRGVGDGYDVLLLTATGQEIRREGRFPNFHGGRSLRTVLRQTMVQVLGEKGQIVPPGFAREKSLVSGNSLAQVTHFLVRSHVRLMRPAWFEGYPLYQRVVILTDTDTGQVHGLMSWFFDGGELARPALAERIARSQGSRIFTPADIPDRAALAHRLREAPGPLGEALRQHLSPTLQRRWLEKGTGSGPTDDDLADLVDDLNRFLLEDWPSLIGSPPSVSPARAQVADGPGLDRVAANRGRLVALLAPALAPVDPPEESPGALRLGGIDPNGRWQPESLVPSDGLAALLTRARVTRTFESDLLVQGGREVLAMAFSPYRFNGYRLVALVDRRELDQGRGFLLGLMGTALLLGVGFLGGAATVISRSLLARVKRLHRFVTAIGQGDFGARVQEAGQDELTQLAATFNTMAEGLQQRERLRQFVSEKVWERTQDAPEQGMALGGQQLDVAILFSRLKGCEDLLEQYPPEEVVLFLQDYHTEFEAAVHEHHGWIDKFIGDQVMAVFDPIPGYPPPPARAMAAASRMQAASSAFDQRQRAAGRFPVRTDIGIHCGPVIAGNVGSSARQGQLAFTVMGDTVNTAARLLGVAEKQPGPGVVVSAAVRENAAPEAAFQPLDRISLKGKSEPLALFLLRTG